MAPAWKFDKRAGDLFFTPLVAFVVSVGFCSLSEISRELENPFAEGPRYASTTRTEIASVSYKCCQMCSVWTHGAGMWSCREQMTANLVRNAERARSQGMMQPKNVLHTMQ